MGLMQQYGIPVPKGHVATTAQQAETIAAEMLQGVGGARCTAHATSCDRWLACHNSSCSSSHTCGPPRTPHHNHFRSAATGEKADVVIKAQVLAGGRGLGTFSNGFHGGVHIVTRAQQAGDIAGKMLGASLITKQTGPEGRICNHVFLVERLYLRREMYISIMLDRSAAGPIIIASPRGGTSIEDVAATSPELIFKTIVDLTKGVTKEQVSHKKGVQGSSGLPRAQSLHTVRVLVCGHYSALSQLHLMRVDQCARSPELHMSMGPVVPHLSYII